MGVGIWQVKRLESTVEITTTAYGDITGLEIPISASARYDIQVRALVQTQSAQGYMISIGYNGAIVGDNEAAHLIVPTNSTHAERYINTFNAGGVTGAAEGADVDMMSCVDAKIIGGAAPGTLIVVARAQTAGQYVRVMSGSLLLWKEHGK